MRSSSQPGPPIPSEHRPDPARPLAVIDIDGVLADVRHRLRHLEGRPKNWDAFFAAARRDPPHAEGMELARALAAEHDILFLTGRPERTRADTERWLTDHGLGGHRLEMRPESDRRPAAQVKVERLAELAADRQVAIVVDDDDRVVAAMRAAGYSVRHADWERRAIEEDRALALAQDVEGRT